MRYTEPSDLLNAVAVVLREVVLPDCASRYVTGQVWAAIGLLENVSTRIEERVDLVESECDLLQDWLAANGVNVGHLESGLAIDRRRELRSLCSATLELALSTRTAKNSTILEVSLRDMLQHVEEMDHPNRRPIRFKEAFRT